VSPASTVLVTSRSFSSGDVDMYAELEAAGLRVVTGPATHDLAVLGPSLANAIAWIAGTGPVTRDHLDVAPALRLIARYGVGTDAVDLLAAAARGVLVTNTPGANSAAVADHTLALMLAALRRVAPGDREVRSGNWRVVRGHQLGRLTVGIVGFGRVGREVAARLSGFGSPVLAHDPWVADTAVIAAGARPVPLDILAGSSGVISLHRPGEDVLVDETFLLGVKPGLLLVNTARATLVDEQAVAEALRSGLLSGYAADTVAAEVTGDSPLLASDLADRTVFTPHTAAQTVEAVDAMGRGAVDAVLAVIRGEQPINLIAAPLEPSGRVMRP
jgi:D-3-phosphoglycerate dehydrogenase